MQQPVDANPVQVVVLVQPGTIDTQSKYKNMKLCFAKQLIGLGILQCVIGILCIILQRMTLKVYNTGDFGYGSDNVGHGIWAGVMFLITGPFGILGGFNRSRWQVLAIIVLSILSAVSATVLLGITVPGAVIYALGETFCDRYYYMPNTTPYYYNRYYTTPDYYNYFKSTSSYTNYFNPPYGHYDCIYNINTGLSRKGTAMEATIAALGLIEVISAVWSVAICLTTAKACSFDCVGSCSSLIKNQLLTINQSSPDQQQLVTNNQQQPSFNQQPQMQPPSYQLLQMQPPTYQPLQMQPQSNQQPQMQPPPDQQPQIQPLSNQQPQMQPPSYQQSQMQPLPDQQPQMQQPSNQQSQMQPPPDQQPQIQPLSNQQPQMQPSPDQQPQMQPLSTQQPQIQPPPDQQPQIQPLSIQQPQIQPPPDQQPQRQPLSNQQPQRQKPSNQQSQMFTPDQAMATVPTWQHTIINLDQGQHVIQFNLHQPNPSPHRQQPDANATVFSSTADQGCNPRMTAGLGINLACPE